MGPEAEKVPEEAQPAKLFDLPETEGVNDSERILTALCHRTFLRLWSQTNVYTDDGFKNGKGATKELCDALVVFGTDVILFSDKHVFFNEAKGIEVAWRRLYKKAVYESCRQLHGAKLWLGFVYDISEPPAAQERGYRVPSREFSVQAGFRSEWS